MQRYSSCTGMGVRSLVALTIRDFFLEKVTKLYYQVLECLKHFTNVFYHTKHRVLHISYHRLQGMENRVPQARIGCIRRLGTVREVKLIFYLYPAPKIINPFNRTLPPPGLIEDSQNDSDTPTLSKRYELEKVINYKQVNSTLFYYVKQKGYNYKYNNWKDTEDIDYAKNLIEDY